MKTVVFKPALVRNYLGYGNGGEEVENVLSLAGSISNPFNIGMFKSPLAA